MSAKSLPAWMLSEWSELRSVLAEDDFTDVIQFIESVLNADECACVWSAIEKRQRENSRAIFSHLLTSLYDFSVAEELEETSISERQQKAARVIDAVKEFRAALKDVHSDKYGWPMQFAFALKTMPPNDDPYRLSATLKRIVSAAKKWVEDAEPPVVKQVNAPNAKRLYFIRQVTNFFQTYYGSPLREQTAALTRVVFRCDIDAATIAKLAPLNKQSAD